MCMGSIMDNKALYNIGYGLYVLTAKDGEKDNGCITNTLMQVSSNPLKAVIAVNKQNFTHDMIMKTKEFNISMLTEDAPFAVYRHFGFFSGRKTNKFGVIDYAKRAENGIKYIDEQYANAYLSCKVTDTADFGTHTLFTAEIVDGKVLSDKPSATYSYYQKNVKPKKTAPAKAKGWQCKICGYIYEGEELPKDFVCPICKHGASDFEKL